MAAVKILVVEDESIVAKDIEETLKSQGYDVPAIASSGEQAIEKAEQMQPDLVLMDIVLKGDVDGIAAADQIRERFDIPVVYLTAYTDEQTVQRAKITEPFAYITKPFEARELRTNIEMALYKHKADKALRRSKQQWEDTFNAISDWVVLTDLKGRILCSNRAGEDFTGVALTQIVGQSCCKLVHGSDKHLPGCPLVEMLRTRRRATAELPVLDGSRWLMVTVDPLMDEEGKLIGAVHIATDITERKRAERLLERERNKAQNYLDVAGVILVAIDVEQRVGLINRKGCEVLGYCEEEIIAKNWFDNFLPERIRDEARTVLGRLVAGEPDAPEYYENPILTKNGDERLIAWHNTILRDENGEIIAALSSGEDITEHKRAEETLLSERNKLVSVFEAMADGVYIVNQQHDIQYVNPVLEKDFGAWQGCKCYQYFHDRKEVCPWCKNEQVFAGRTVRWEWYSFKNEKTYDLIDTPLRNPDGSISKLEIFRDITERKKAEEEIEKLAKFPSENPNPVLRIAEDGTILYANIASSPVLETWGCREGQRLPDDCYKRLEQAVDSGKAYSFEFNCHNGRIFLVALAPVAGAHYVNAYGLDITERKKAEEAVLEYQGKLKSSTSELFLAEERERRRIADGIHDDIGTKLALAKFELQSLMEGAAETAIAAPLESVCAEIDKVIEDARSLTFELSNPVLYEVGLDAAVESWLGRHIGKKSRLRYEVASEPRPLKPDMEISVVLFGVIRELLTNVVKHADASMVQVHIQKDGETIRVSIEDDGVGFELSKAGLPVRENGGFGLFSAREKVEYLGGVIEIESRPGQGTCIRISVPVQQGTSR